MVLLNEAKNLIDSEDTHSKVEHESLLDKYKIPVTHFEYSYIEKCKDGRELERMVQVLRSGEEGHFPDLTRFAENRLAVVKPKSRLLRKAAPVLSKENLTRDERNELTNDLMQWVVNVSKDDDELNFFKNRNPGSKSLPDIRERKEIFGEEKKTPKRISSTDYSSWDKYDPDTEILKMDLDEEKLKKSAIQKKKPKKKTVQFREFSTDVEALHEANYEKDKGNEFFKAGDYEEALRHYTDSINCKPTLPGFTNRALTNLKLKKYKNALDDCHSALAIEPDNFKAFLRKAQALEGLGQHVEALETIEQAIEINPNNELAQELADKFRNQCGSFTKKTTRFVVEEVQKGDKKEVIIPIPGTSKMSPPHYVTCLDGNPEKVKEEIVRANTPSQIVHMISVDNSDVDDDDSCTVNHLKKLCSDINVNSPSSRNSVCSLTGKNNKKNRLPQVIKEDKCAGGEPYTRENDYIDLPQDINSPYSFLKTWNSANIDPTLEQHAAILRSVDMNRIVDVIGCKLDNAMFSKIIKCLCTHFAVPSEVNRLNFILSSIVNLPRFDIISMLMSPDDKNCVNILVNFLKQHGKSVSEDVINKFFNN